jgi:hypothetical protein
MSGARLAMAAHNGIFCRAVEVCVRRILVGSRVVEALAILSRAACVGPLTAAAEPGTGVNQHRHGPSKHGNPEKAAG